MTRRGNGRRSNNNASQPPSQLSIVQTRLNAMDKRINGRKVVPAPNPPVFVEVPWNSWTFERLATTTTDLESFEISVADITAQIRGRLGIKDTSTIWLKVQSAYVWCTASGSTFALPDMEVSFYELSGEPSTQHKRSIQRDKGTLNMPAKTGYVYPISDSREILGNTTERALSVVQATATESGSNITVRVHVLYQSTA